MKQIRFIPSDDTATSRKMQRGGRMTEPLSDEDDELAALSRERAEQVPRGSGVALPPARVRRAPELPGWTRFSTPLLLITIALLLAIGGWALGAVVYMHKVDPIAPEDVRYPLLRWSDDVGTSGGYSTDSRIIPVAMLGALPLAFLLLLILIYLRKQRRGMHAGTAAATIPLATPGDGDKSSPPTHTASLPPPPP
jgi:hypothetical protein